MHISSAFPLSVLALALADGAAADSVWATPHDSYSSSVGVLGCKINTNRVAYWPDSVDCNNLCVQLSYGGRSVNLLRVDQSGGAYDISYDAWNYLQTGESATTDPIEGGPVEMEYTDVDASECADLIYTDGSQLPLSAANSMNFVSSCLAEPSSWVAQNYVLYNICDPLCSLGYDEVCSLNLATSNQPSCPHTLGLDTQLTSAPVYNIEYPSGQTVEASTGEVVPANVNEGSPANSPLNSQANSPASSPASSPTEQVTPSGAVFAEYSSTSVPTAQPTTIYPTSSWATHITPSYSQTAAAQYTISPNAGKPSTNSSTTISVGTFSSSQSTASKNPGSVATVQPVNAGHAAASVPAVALVSSMIICSILNAF